MKESTQQLKLMAENEAARAEHISIHGDDLGFKPMVIEPLSSDSSIHQLLFRALKGLKAATQDSSAIDMVRLPT